MTLVHGIEKAYSLGITQRVGTGRGYGGSRRGISRFGDNYLLAGIYSIKHTLKGRQTSRMTFYRPTNPQTPAQNERRSLFAGGVILWHALTSDEKSLYNKKGKSRHLSGFNYFMSLHMRS